MARIWLLLALVGAATPLIWTGTFISDHGLDFDALLDPLGRNSLALIAAIDLALSVLVFLLWSFGDARRRGITQWPTIAAGTIILGLCFGLPAYLWLRERQAPGDAAATLAE